MKPDPTKIYVRCPNKDCAKVLSFKGFSGYKDAPIVCPHCGFRGVVRDFTELRPRLAPASQQPVAEPLQPQPSPQPTPAPEPQVQPRPDIAVRQTMRGERQAVASATVILENTVTGERQSLSPGDNVIGRRTATPRAQVLFDDPDHYMSRCQAVVTVRAEASGIVALLRDAGSANGTFVNGVRLPEGTMVRLASGDTFVMGKRTYRLVIDAGPATRRRMSDTILLH